MHISRLQGHKFPKIIQVAETTRDRGKSGYNSTKEPERSQKSLQLIIPRLHKYFPNASEPSKFKLTKNVLLTLPTRLSEITIHGSSDC